MRKQFKGSTRREAEERVLDWVAKKMERWQKRYERRGRRGAVPGDQPRSTGADALQGSSGKRNQLGQRGMEALCLATVWRMQEEDDHSCILSPLGLALALEVTDKVVRLACHRVEVQEQQQRQEAAQRVLAAVLVRRRKRREDLAARLVQWTWRRRHLLPERGVRWPVIKPIPRCLYGTVLASKEEFEEQRQKADAVLDHWRTYCRIFHRLEGRPFVIGDLCCSEGGQSAGIESMGGVAKGLDITDQPRWRAKFGEENFHLGSVLKGADLAQLGEVDGWVCSPPCQGGSTMPKAGGGLTESREPMILAETRRQLELTGKPWLMENVVGTYAKGLIRKDVVLRNHDFGLRASRPRVFEANYAMVKEAALEALAKDAVQEVQKTGTDVLR